MHAVRYRNAAGEIRLGRLEDETIVDAGSAGPQGFVPSVEGWAVIAAASGSTTAAADVQLLHPVVPSKVIAIGLNYRDHAKESDLDIPAMPVVFSKFSTSLIGHGESIVIPREETRPDFEGELAVIIGKRTHRATLNDALSAIGGITCVHDVSGRRAQLETPLRQFDYGKSFDTFCPLGPSVASTDGVNFADIDVELAIDGEVMQSSNTKHLIFSVAEIIEYLTRGITLLPGDVICTGTPGGVGDSRDPRRYLREGETVTVTVGGVGSLSNPVTFEQ
jgi:2-keto-4-pentenoate hydratase/2-oxohepta-3-ene-1,7-dioic acid hydratase in catechol pathway